jgi:uncharacterized protein (DUF427 family)
MNPAPGFKKRPEYRIAVKPSATRVQVLVNGEVIADSKETLMLEEGNYSPVYYFPRRDVKMDRLVRSPLQTYCPFKGDAAYYSFSGGAENAVWSYEHPYDEMHAIRERLAFYPNKVEIKAL